MRNKIKMKRKKAMLIARTIAVALLAVVMLISVNIFANMTPASTDKADVTESVQDQVETVAQETDITLQSEEEESGELPQETSYESDSEAVKSESEWLTQRTIVADSDGYEVSVSGLLPEDAKLHVEEIGENNNLYDRYLKDAAGKVLAEESEADGDTLPYARFFDINVKYYNDEKEFEPESALSVNIDLKDNILATEDVDFSAVHFNERNNDPADYDTEILPVNIDADKNDSVVNLEANSFSVYGVVYFYTVDFYYTSEDGDTTEYHMNGGSEMTLSELFTELGIDKNMEDIESVDFTDTSLVTFTKSGDDYTIKSFKPFTTGEELTITFADGEVIVIGVEDDSTDSGTIGVNDSVTWEIDDGKLIIRPTTEGSIGTLPNVNGLLQNPSDDEITAKWPWHKYADSITSVVVESGVKTQAEARHMFSGLSNATTIDLSGLDASPLGVTNEMFKNCSAVTEITFPNNFAPKQLQGMCTNCSALTTLTFGSINDPYNPKSIIRNGNKPAWDNFGSGNRGAFGGCTSLTTLKMPGADLSASDSDFVDSITKLVNAFNGANNSGKTINVSGAKLNSNLTRNIFKYSNIEDVEAVGTTFDCSTASNLRTIFHSDANGDTPANQKYRVINLTSAKFNNAVSAFKMFKGITTLEELYLTDAEFPDGVTNYAQLADACSGLKKVEITADDTDGNGQTLSIKGATSMASMFRNCTSLTNLDISGFGKLENITNMGDMLKGCKALEYLNIDNLDNSVLEPQKLGDNPTHAHNTDNRMMFGADGNPAEDFPNLKTLSAKKSNVWFVKNNTVGIPGQELYLASNESDIYYLTKKITTYTSDDSTGNKVEIIDSKRDWIDLIKDRDQKSSGADTMPDAAYNINYKDGDLNTNGAGKLAPGVYEIGKDPWIEPTIALEDTYYRISNISNSTPTVNVTDSKGRLSDDISGTSHISQPTHILLRNGTMEVWRKFPATTAF